MVSANTQAQIPPSASCTVPAHIPWTLCDAMGAPHSMVSSRDCGLGVFRDSYEWRKGEGGGRRAFSGICGITASAAETTWTVTAVLWGWRGHFAVSGRVSGGNSRGPSSGCATRRGLWEYFREGRQDEDSQWAVDIPPMEITITLVNTYKVLTMCQALSYIVFIYLIA